MPTEATIQADVAPGNETGIYYITICNLPFGTSWQQLKDWTRTACVVDHIEVFQGSTSGWVRVKGRENFENAWAGLLNGGVFNGRLIVASDKNRSHSIKIRELVMPPQRTQKPQQGAQMPQQGPQISQQRPQIPQTPQYQPAPVPPTRHMLPTPMTAPPPYSIAPEQISDPRFVSHPLSTQGYTQQPPIIVATSVPFGPATYAAVGPGSYYAYDYETRSSHNPIAYAPPNQPEGPQFALPYPGLDEHSDFYHECKYSTREPPYRSEWVLTEPRKIHVSPFPQQARAEDVKSWIRRRVDKTKIDSMEIPKNSNSKYLRGYVLVVFDSASAANMAIEQLNKARFQGRRVIARPTRESAVVEQPGFSHETTTWGEPKSADTNTPTAGHRARDGDRHRNEKTQRPKNRETKSGSSDKKKAPLPDKKASGSKGDKKSSSKKPPSQEEISRKDEGPVVVDGTCQRHDK
ncbi:uncharacterized protein FIESC28_04492 [Fusarium coffeatum]|uniref:RRM domain-containing protein n=1 Tax=Fusarium coffeatum TaxID=231269 RepID=A0A366S0K1_9HYPO|nr:uncharacterized protein FIESC28_04492 [Fusarium coffeatum]RBR22398.1 hypothetical protein FIESC28_04492 [Fusarium coffeatum]